MIRIMLALVVLASMALAIPIPIPNGSFESPVVGSTFPSYPAAPGGDFWYRVVINPVLGAGAAGARSAVGGLPPTLGAQMAGIGRNSALYQQGIALTPLGGSLLAGTYTFTYDVGVRSDQPKSTPYTIEFYGWDGSSAVPLLGSTSGTAPGATGWSLNQSFTFVATTNSAISALQLRIINNQGGTGSPGSIIGGGDAYQINFDNLRLDYVPEPGAYALMGTVGLALFLLRRRKAGAAR